MNNHSPRLMVFLVILLLTCFLQIDFKQAELNIPTPTNHENVYIPAPSSFSVCYFDIAKLVDEGDLEKDIEDDGNFSKDLDTISSLEFEITPLPSNANSRFRFAALFYLQKGFNYESFPYESPYLNHFQPPKISFLS